VVKKPRRPRLEEWGVPLSDVPPREDVPPWLAALAEGVVVEGTPSLAAGQIGGKRKRGGGKPPARPRVSTSVAGRMISRALRQLRLKKGSSN